MRHWFLELNSVPLWGQSTSERWISLITGSQWWGIYFHGMTSFISKLSCVNESTLVYPSSTLMWFSSTIMALRLHLAISTRSTAWFNVHRPPVSLQWRHNGAAVSQITSFTIVYSIVYSGADQRRHQSFASLDFVLGIHWWPLNSPHKWPVTRKIFPFDDVIMITSGVKYYLPMDPICHEGLWAKWRAMQGLEYNASSQFNVL